MTALKICPTCSAEYPANERFCPRDGTALRAQGAAGGDLVGSIVAERYHVIRKLGEGGMGTVYLAEHVKMGRKSAVKVMNPGMGQDADAISRFNREASNASRINHPHVAGIYDFGETPDGLIYLAMEYVEGESLTSMVRAQGALPAMRAAEITRQAAEGLSVAHEMGIVHRDLKPDNIMLAKNRDGSDCVKVVDFGIAKAASNEAQKVTRTGLVVGTPEYMSPEQLAGDPLDGRSDVYSLALVAFHMLTGTLPFPSETAQEAMIMRLTDRPRTLAEMKPDVTWTPKVQQVMDRALERDAKARYQTASEFGRALHAAVREMPSSAEGSASTLLMGAVTGTVPKTRLAPAEPAPSGTGLLMQRPNRARVAMAAGVVGTLLLGGAVYATQRDRTTVVQGDSTAAARAMTDSMPTGASSPVAPPLQTSESPTDSVTGRPAGGLAGVAPTSSSSYAGELHSLWESVADPASARQAEQRLGSYRGTVRTRADVAAVALIDAKAALLTGGAERGCGIMRRIDAAALSNKMRQELLEALATCESP